MAINRTTFSSNLLLIRSNLDRAQSQYTKAAIPATSGLRINGLGDEPLSISRLFSLRSLSSNNEQYQKNINTVQTFLNNIDSRLTQGADVMERVREITLKSIDPTINSSLLNQLGDQILALKNELTTIANTRLENRYIFSGTSFNTQPFTGDPVTFNGNSTQTSLQITPNLSMATNLDGNHYFMGEVDDATGTTLAADARNSNGVNLGLVTGDVITLAGDIGGAFSDTLTVTATTTLSDVATFMQATIRANGAGTETVAVQADGSLRVTAGASQIDNLNLTTPSRPYFDTAFTYPATIAAAGTGDSDALLTGSGEDVFDMLDDLAAAVISGDSTEITTHLDRLDRSIDQLMNGRAVIGVRLQQLSAVEDSLSEDSLRFAEELSNLQDADLDKSLSDLVSRETALRLVFASSSKVLQALSSLQLNV